MTELAVYESSGLWDASIATWKKAADQLQRSKVNGVKVALGVHTEATRDKVIAAFRHQPGRWSFVRMEDGSEEIVLTFDRDLIDVHKARAVLMSRTPLRTQRGHLKPRTYMLEAVCTIKATGRRLYVQGEHWELDNTPNRRKAWAESEDKVQYRWERIMANDPDALILHLGDLNKNVREKAERDRVLALAGGVPGMHQSWNLRNLPAHGTRGRQIIDNGLTNMRLAHGGAVLLRPVKGFDHRPFGCLYRAPALRDPALGVPRDLPLEPGDKHLNVGVIE